MSLSKNTTVGSTLTLTDGVVVTGANYLIMTSTATADLQPTTPTNASFVNGNLRRYIASNTSTYAFPAGNGTATTNFYLAELINGNLTGITYIDSKFGALVAGGTLGVSEEGTDYTSVATEGVWYLDPDAVPTGGDYDLKCYIANFAGLTNNEFTILKRPTASSNAADWVCTPCGFGDPGINSNNGLGRMTTDGYAMRLGLTSFSQFAIGKSGAPLPIELASFFAVCEGDNIKVSWITASESNNDFFTVEKSYDGTDFYVDTIIGGAGNSSSWNYYQYTDETEGENLIYYRLKQTDYDGKYSYSDLVIVEGCGNIYNDGVVKIYSFDQKTVLISVISSAEKDYNIAMYDSRGRMLSSDMMRISKGENLHELHTKDLATGMYLITLHNENEYISKKIILH